MFLFYLKIDFYKRETKRETRRTIPWPSLGTKKKKLRKNIEVQTIWAKEHSRPNINRFMSNAATLVVALVLVEITVMEGAGFRTVVINEISRYKTRKKND